MQESESDVDPTVVETEDAVQDSDSDCSYSTFLDRAIERMKRSYGKTLQDAARVKARAELTDQELVVSTL